VKSKLSNPAAGIQPGSRYPTRQQVFNPAAGIQPDSRYPTRQQVSNPAAGIQPSGRYLTRQLYYNSEEVILGKKRIWLFGSTIVCDISHSCD